MPELPEVETTLRGIEPYVVGFPITQVVVRNPHLRWPVKPELPSLLQGHSVRKLARRSKYIVMQFDHGSVLWHLGMSGNLRILEQSVAPKKHDHVDWVFSSGRVLRFNDPRRFGALVWTTEPVAQHALIAHLGPEPLTDALDADYLFARSRKRTLAVKSWLMDAKVVVGVGNIYANEALYASAIHPLTPAGKLTGKQCEQLVLQVKRILAEAVVRGGTTLRDFVGSDGKPGYFAQELKVYGRAGEPCVHCQKVLEETRLAQRSTVYCSQCQKR